MDRVISHYRLIERLGGGGGGEVYRAEDMRLGRVVALKVLDGPGALDEARAAASLNHPNVATVYDVGEAGGHAFIALEYVEGEMLATRLARGPLPLGEALGVAIQIARALEATHERGLVHGDVTASNVVLATDGTAKMLDFGLSHAAAAAAVAAGTPGYLAPEQLGGDAPDARADIFSLGVVLYEMVAGHRPFAREAWRRALLDGEPSPLGAAREGVPLELERIVRRALERDRDLRYGSAAELAADLERLRAELDRDAARAAPPVRPASEGAAFRGLLPFQEGDRDRFFGREAETAALVARVMHADFRFGVLYGDSGSGKTSLLRAAVMPALWEAGFAAVYVRSHQGPLEALAAECRAASGVARREGEPVGPYLARVTDALAAPLVVVLDQFEEFFVAFKTAESREPFLAALAACYADPALDVRFLVAMRSDFLYLIGSELAGRVPEPLATSRLFHLRTFDEAAAAEVVERSALRAGLPFEPGLSRHVARDLAVEGAVLPSELQIVGERLQSRRIFSVREYRRAGGKELLVYSFLEDVIRATGDRDAAGLLLRSLISDENTRLTLEAAEIARRTQRSRETVARLLGLFVEARLVRELQEAQPWRYELVHEYLVDQINRVTGRVFDATQRANRLLRQYSSSYAADPRTRVPLDKLLFVRRYTDRALGERERELFRKSLRWGIVRAAALVALVAVAAVATAAAFSIEERWAGARLSDGHTAAVRRAVFSPDGRLLVTCGEDRKVIVWDFARRQRLATLDAHTDWVTTVAFSPDGSVFATGSDDRTLIVWDARRFEPVAVLRSHDLPVGSIAFSPDGRWLVSAPRGPAEGVVWRAGAWTIERLLPGCSTSWANVLFVTRDRVHMEGRAWDVETGVEVGRFDGGPSTGYNWAAVSPDGTRVLQIDVDGTVRFNDAGRGGQLAERRPHHDHGRAAAYSPDGRFGATGAENIVLWDAATMTKLARLEHSSIVWSLAFSPDGRWLVSTHGDGSVMVWDVAERERAANLAEHCAPVRGVAFSPDGRRIVTTSEDWSAIVWDAGTGAKEATLVGHRTRVAAAAFSPDGTEVATIDQAANLFLWDAASGRLLETLRPPPEHSGRAGYCVAFTPGGRFLVASDYVVERATGRVAADFFAGHDPIGYYAVAFTPDGRRVIGVSPSHVRIDVRSTDTWEIVARTVMPEKMSFVTVSMAPDGRTFATGDDEGRVLVWDAETIELLGEVGRHTARVKSVAFSPDGELIASCGDDQTVTLWDVRTRSRAATVGTHAAPVLAVAFSPDGRRLVAGGHDHSARVFTRRRDLWGYELD